MANSLSLKDLIEGLAGAVIEAQDRIEQHQISVLSSYFDEQDRPRSIVMRLPSMHPHARPGDEDLYRAPLLPLVPINPLKIKEVEISFDVDLGNVADIETPDSGKPAGNTDSTGNDSPWSNHQARIRKHVQIQPCSGLFSRRGTAAHVVMKVEGSEASDGLARLVSHLSMTQGVFRTLSDSDPEVNPDGNSQAAG